MAKKNKGRPQGDIYTATVARLLPFVTTKIFEEKVETFSDEALAKAALDFGIPHVTHTYVRSIREKLMIPNAGERYKARLRDAVKHLED